MAVLPADLLTRPAEEAARLVALDRLDAAAAALARCLEADDPDALHDFRVALRRLRSLVRAYRPQLKGGAPKRLRRRLRQVSSGTNEGRDAEVLLDWLRVQHESLSARERVGWRWLVARVEAREREAAEALPNLAARFRKVEQRLRRRLATYRLTVELEANGAAAAHSFGAVTAAALRALAADLEARFSDAPVPEPEDAAAVHSARIAAKRLRYLLEPVANEAGAELVLERLRALQDLLGELNDAHNATLAMAKAVEAAGAERSRELFEKALEGPSAEGTPVQRRDERPGLVALARTVGARWKRGFVRLDGEWLHGRATPFFRELEALAGRLESPTPRRPSDAGAPEGGAGRWSAAGRAARRSRRAPRGV